MLIVGDREVEGETVSVRSRGEGDLGVRLLAEFADSLRNLVDTRAAKP
jgi:threonyl-tRNA synthetase